MPITGFPRGVSSYGIPVLGSGGARYTGWWGVTSWFVDYDHGSDSNTGKEPTDAYKNLQTAITAAGIGDVIYVRSRDQDITSTDPESILPASTTNWSIAEAKTHLSIIGASNVSHIPTQEGRIAVYLRGNATATTGPVMDWQGAFGLIENLAFHRGATTSGGVLKLAGNSTSLRALGTVVNSCLFRLANHTMGAIYNVDNWFITIYGCEFHDCRKGIVLQGSVSTIRRSRISHCLFRNQTATSVDVNIHDISSASTQDVTIDNCVFACNAPNYSGGFNQYIKFDGAATGVIYNCSFPSDTTEGTDGITNNGLDMIDCHQARATADSEAFGKAT